MKDIIHQYYKKEWEGGKMLVQVNPESFGGVTLIIDANGKVEKKKRQFDAGIFEEIVADGFCEASSLEFNLYLNGLA